MIKARFDPGQEIVDIDGRTVNLEELLSTGNYEGQALDFQGTDLDTGRALDYFFLEYSGRDSTGSLLILKITPSEIRIYDLRSVGESDRVDFFDTGYVHRTSLNFDSVEFFDANTGKLHFLDSRLLNEDGIELEVEGEPPFAEDLVEDMTDLFNSFQQDDGWHWTFYLILKKVCGEREHDGLMTEIPLNEELIDYVFIRYKKCGFTMADP